MIGEFSLFHWLVVFAIILLIMGPKRLPELAKALGSGIRDFKKALNSDESHSNPTQITQTRQVQPEPNPPVRKES